MRTTPCTHKPVDFAAGKITKSYVAISVAWWRSGYGIGLATNRSQVRVPAAPLHVTTLGKLFTHNVPLSLSSIISYWPKGGDALAMYHRHSGIDLLTYGLDGLGREMSSLRWSTTASLPLLYDNSNYLRQE